MGLHSLSYLNKNMSKLVPRAFKLLNSQMNRKLLTSHYQLAAAYWFD